MGLFNGRKDALRAAQEEREQKPLRERLVRSWDDEEPRFGRWKQSREMRSLQRSMQREMQPGLGAKLYLFWDSGKGKMLLAAVFCAAILGTAAAVALSMWIKPPDLPIFGGDGDASDAVVQTGGTDHSGLTDDELYPDDGYNGAMPTVSGDRKEGVYTFLLVGTDQDDGNTDTIMVVSYDTVNQTVNIMSIPRDTMVNVRWDIKKINSVYSVNGRDIDALRRQVRTLIGFQPDFYVKVDLSMFVELVDLIGGVEFDVPQNMDYDDSYQNLHIHLDKGLQTLDGQKAMQLVRFRSYPEGDIKRVEVQQDFIKALIEQCLSLEHWGKIKAYIDLALQNVETDLEFGSIVWFAANVLGLNSAPALKMEDVNTYTLPGSYSASAYSRSTDSEQSYVTIYPNQVVKVINDHFNPYRQQVTTAMLDVMSILESGDIASSTGILRDTSHNEIMAVRRGEAYYDDDGNLVHGTPPPKPEQDADGNYYILDEDGSRIYTDANGTPLPVESEPEPELPDDEPTQSPSGSTGNTGNTGTTGSSGNTGTTGSNTSTGNTGNTGNAGNNGDAGNTETTTPPGGTTEPTQPGGETVTPDEPVEEPPEEQPAEPEEPEDTEPPGWLFG